MTSELIKNYFQYFSFVCWADCAALDALTNPSHQSQPRQLLLLQLAQKQSTITAPRDP